MPNNKPDYWPVWLDLRTAAAYCCLSVRTIRRYIGHEEHPLPVHSVGGKWLISREELDAWLARFPQAGVDIDRVVNEVMEGLR
jgi:excisionase family DNA binding protein